MALNRTCNFCARELPGKRGHGFPVSDGRALACPSHVFEFRKGKLVLVRGCISRFRGKQAERDVALPGKC